MPYREYTAGNRYYRHGDAGRMRFSAPRGIEPDSELARLARELKAELKDLLGVEGFYQWACKIPNWMIGDPQLFAQAIRAKLDELRRAPRAPQQPTQLCLFALDGSFDSRIAEDSAPVTISGGQK